MTTAPLSIVMAEDDAEDQLLVGKAFQQSPIANDLRFVNDGEELLRYLRREGPYRHAAEPDLVLLDLNMPRKDGREALAEIKRDPALNHIPVVVMTTSDAEEDVLSSYNLGASSYIQKPVNFDSMLEVAETLSRYWLGIVKLPPGEGST